MWTIGGGGGFGFLSLILFIVALNTNRLCTYSHPSQVKETIGGNIAMAHLQTDKNRIQNIQPSKMFCRLNNISGDEIHYQC